MLWNCLKAINRSELDKNCAVTVKNGELKFYGKLA